MRHRQTIATAVLLSLVLVSMADGQARKAGDVELTPDTATHDGVTYPVDVGSLWVPMNREDPASPLIELKFVRYRSRAAEPGPPLIFLAGGPGGSGIGTVGSARGQLFLEMLDERDYIAFDQRGTGNSEPLDLRVNPGIALPLDEPMDPKRHAERFREAARVALREMKERGIDFRGLTTEQSADDLNALRAALGYDAMVLWGSSYGTHLSLATVRRHGAHVAAVILAGTEGPDHSFKRPANIQTNLERLADLVRRDPVYREKMPDLVGTVRSVLEDLERNPRTVTLVPGRTVTIGHWDLQRALSTPMGSRSGMEELPSHIHAMAHGDFFALARNALDNRRVPGIWGMSLVMDCASWATSERLALIEREAEQTLLGAAIDYPFPCWCEVEGMPRLPDAFRTPVRSEVPALFISGTLDGRTPVSNAEEIAAGFPNAQHLVIRRAAHGSDLFVSSPKILTSVRTFLRGGRLAETLIDGPEWRFAPPYERSLEHFVLQSLTSAGYDATVERYRAIRAEPDEARRYDLRESVLNDLGYGLINGGMLDLAIHVFRLNTVAYPDASNAWDSLAEGHLNRGDRAEAIEYYERSLELNPGNAGAVRMLERLRGG